MFGGYRISFRDQQQQAIGYAVIPCAPGCRGSESDPRYCRCVCQGINHGILITGRSPVPIPIPQGYNPSFALQQLPEEHHFMLPDKTAPVLKSERLIFPAGRAMGKVARPIGRSIGRSFKHAMVGFSQAELNENVFNGLRRQYNQENTEKVIVAAQTEFYMQNPNANTPELYELYENGDIDRALARDNKAWVTGRPKKRN